MSISRSEVSRLEATLNDLMGAVSDVLALTRLIYQNQEKLMASNQDLSLAIDKLSQAQATLITGFAAANEQLKQAHAAEDPDALAAAVSRIDELTRNAVVASGPTPSSSTDVGPGGESISGAQVAVPTPTPIPAAGPTEGTQASGSTSGSEGSSSAASVGSSSSTSSAS